MTDDELKAIEAQCSIWNRYVATGDVLALVAEVRRLRALLGVCAACGEAIEPDGITYRGPGGPMHGRCLST